MNKSFYKQWDLTDGQVEMIQREVAAWRRSHANASPAEVEEYAGTLADEVTAGGEGADKPDPPKRKR